VQTTSLWSEWNVNVTVEVLCWDGSSFASFPLILLMVYSDWGQKILNKMPLSVFLSTKMCHTASFQFVKL